MSTVLEINDEQFAQEVLESQENVLVYFWAKWCGPCRLVSPSIQWAAQNYSERLKVVKLEVDPNPKSVAQFQVEGVPALRLFKRRELHSTFEGALSKKQLQEFLDVNLS
jgi:thioredoxin 1